MEIFNEIWFTGGNYDANLIFSPNSYFPRSAMINLTVDIFGESINIFEVAILNNFTKLLISKTFQKPHKSRFSKHAFFVANTFLKVN